MNEGGSSEKAPSCWVVHAAENQWREDPYQQGPPLPNSRRELSHCEARCWEAASPKHWTLTVTSGLFTDTTPAWIWQIELFWDYRNDTWVTTNAGGSVARLGPKQCGLIKHVRFSRLAFVLFFQMKGIGRAACGSKRELFMVGLLVGIKMSFIYSEDCCPSAQGESRRRLTQRTANTFSIALNVQDTFWAAWLPQEVSWISVLAFR